MGLMVDKNVFIRFEKSGNAIDFSSWEPTYRRLRARPAMSLADSILQTASMVR
jgi:hypothetical protein